MKAEVGNKMETSPLKLSGLAVLAALGLLSAGCDDNDTVVYNVTVRPAVPTGVTTVTGDGFVDIYWNPVFQENVAGYGVYRSATLNGQYNRIATVTGVESNFHRDTGLVNGVTVFYAVDAFDQQGNESDLSYEDAFDTPRPAGQNVTVAARQVNSGSSAIDFSDYALPTFVTSFTAADADLFFQQSNGVLYAKGTQIAGVWNDIQDLGFTETMDDVSWSPAEGWSIALDGVELIVGHTYVVWTWDSYFAKFRVVQLLGPTIAAPTGAVIDWAYQVDQNNPELISVYNGHRKTRATP
ncbi:MAG TPA: hypothetical protein VFR10_10195 [bacterium]|nr:hypothetical protein [bacterium]